jgi:hypothetical protein
VKPVPTFPARVSDAGVLDVSQTQKQAMRRWVRTLKGQDVEIVVRKKQDKRSIDQNAYFHAVPVELMAEEWGVSHDEAYYLLLAEWKGYKDGPLGRMPNVTSGSKLTREDFSALIKWVLDYGPSEWNCYIPAPNEVDLKRTA